LFSAALECERRLLTISKLLYDDAFLVSDDDDNDVDEDNDDVEDNNDMADDAKKQRYT
jgi:hypothetical protein